MVCPCFDSGTEIEAKLIIEAKKIINDIPKQSAIELLNNKSIPAYSTSNIFDCDGTMNNKIANTPHKKEKNVILCFNVNILSMNGNSNVATMHPRFANMMI